jgi:5-methylcytosine-specific restriction endonuclease McrA
MPTYQEKLQDDRWLRISQETRERAGNRCEDCGATGVEFNAHHRVYDRGKEPWQYPPENFVCVCRPCHRRREKIATLSRVVFQVATPADAEEFLQWIMRQPQNIDTLLKGWMGAKP